MLRTAIFILSHFEKKLLTLPYEGLLMFLNEIPGTGFYTSEKILDEYGTKLRKLKVSKQLVLRFKEEEGRIREISERREFSELALKGKFKFCVEKDAGYVNVHFPS